MADRAVAEKMLLRENTRSFKKYSQRHQIEFENLKSTNNDIEYERKVSKNILEREHKVVAEQLRRMKLEKEMYAMKNLTRVPDQIVEPVEDGDDDDIFEDAQSPEEDVFVNPYPVMLTSLYQQQIRTRSESVDDDDVETKGMRYARNRGRRMSKEFEDLNMNTKTGTLLPPVRKSDTQTQKTHPKLQRQKSVNDFVEQNQWIGDPEAIHSVRRPRKSIHEQQRDFIIKRSMTSDALLLKKSTSPSLHRRSMDSSSVHSITQGYKAGSDFDSPSTPRRRTSTEESPWDSLLGRQGSGKRGGPMSRSRPQTPQPSGSGLGLTPPLTRRQRNTDLGPLSPSPTTPRRETFTKAKKTPPSPSKTRKEGSAKTPESSPRVAKKHLEAMNSGEYCIDFGPLSPRTPSPQNGRKSFSIFDTGSVGIASRGSSSDGDVGMFTVDAVSPKTPRRKTRSTREKDDCIPEETAVSQEIIDIGSKNGFTQRTLISVDDIPKC